MASTTSRVFTQLMRRQGPSIASSSSNVRKRLLATAAVKAGATNAEKFMHLEVSEDWDGGEGGREEWRVVGRV